MNEQKTTAKRRQVCDICGQFIEAGAPIRIIRDDYMPGIVSFEHVVCPHNGAHAPRPEKTETGRQAPLNHNI